jgi:hypothetical protein
MGQFDWRNQDGRDGNNKETQGCLHFVVHFLLWAGIALVSLAAGTALANAMTYRLGAEAPIELVTAFPFLIIGGVVIGALARTAMRKFFQSMDDRTLAIASGLCVFVLISLATCLILLLPCMYPVYLDRGELYCPLGR